MELNMPLMRMAAHASALGLITIAGGQGIATAEPICLERAQLMDVLARDFGETLSAHGERSRVGKLELFVRDDGQSWTLVVSLPDGLSCVVDAGSAWQSEAQRRTGPKI
jgi:hypothetical protein